MKSSSKGSGEEAGKAKMSYPTGAYFILIGYLLERFVYYGLFGAVVFYMQRVLQFSAPSASSAKAVMEGLIYLAPIPGAILADTYLGKVKTVSIMCCFYIVGALVFTLSSISPIMTSVAGTQAAGIGGILILGLSAGLMKAVYTSLGADQFQVPEQRREQQRYFYALYWMINAGAFLGQFLTAQLRESVQCFNDDCYMLPFLILCGSMIISTAVFYSGKKRYKVQPPDPMMLNSLKCLYYAAKKSIVDRSKKVTHWVDRSADKYDAGLIKDVKKMLRVLLLFVTYPFFWALFFQTSTGMIFQAKRLHDRIGTYRIPPELTSSINPLIIIVLIPIFEFGIYPLLAKKGWLTKTTSRMLLGMILAASAFVMYGFISLSIEQPILGSKRAQLNIYNAKSCPIVVKSDLLKDNIVIGSVKQEKFDNLDIGDETKTFKLEYGCVDAESKFTTVKLLEEHETTVILFPMYVHVHQPTKDYLKDKDAEAKVRVTCGGSRFDEKVLGTYNLKYGSMVESFSLENNTSPFKTLSPQNYTLSINNDTLGQVNIRQDGVYDIVIYETNEMIFDMTSPVDLHMAVLIPQYLIITTGELLFSVSALDFAHSEAPDAMKAVIQAFNLFTITVGLWVYAAFTKITAATQIFDYRASTEAFTYAVGMAINAVVFLFLVRHYYKCEDDETNLTSNEKSGLTKMKKKNEEARDNPGFEAEEKM